jgi:hypothetical protein
MAENRIGGKEDQDPAAANHPDGSSVKGSFDEEGTFFYIPFSGFSIDNSVRIFDQSGQEGLAEYIAHLPDIRDYRF